MKLMLKILLQISHSRMINDFLKAKINDTSFARDNVTTINFDSILPNCACLSGKTKMASSLPSSQLCPKLLGEIPQRCCYNLPSNMKGVRGKATKVTLLFGLIPTLFQQIRKLFSLIFNLTLAIKDSREY